MDEGFSSHTHKFDNVDFILITFSSLLFGAIYTAFFGQTLSTAESSGFLADYLYRCMGLTAYALTLLVARFVSAKASDAQSPLQKSPLRLALFLAGLPLIAVALLGETGIAVPQECLPVFWVFFGISCACMSVESGCGYASVDPFKLRANVAAALFVGAVWYLIASCLIPLASTLLLAAMIIAEAAYLLQSPRVLAPNPQPKEKSQHGPTTKLTIVWMLEGFVYSFTAFYLMIHAPHIAAVCVVGLATFVSSFMVVALAGGSGRKTYDALWKISLPLMILSLFAMPFVDYPITLVLGFVLICFLGSSIFRSWLLTALVEEHDKQHSAYHFARNRWTVMAGFALGGICCSTLYLSPLEGAIPSYSVAAFTAALVAVAVSLSVFGDDRGSDDIILGLESCDGEEAAGSRLPGRWRRRCNMISAQANLTPREHEVFLLLAKGRNATRIKDKLVISEGTAKTHIYHIYNKLGVSTQQELIDLVEDDAAAPPSNEHRRDCGAHTRL